MAEDVVSSGGDSFREQGKKQGGTALAIGSSDGSTVVAMGWGSEGTVL